jgi:hypothetical protein
MSRANAVSQAFLRWRYGNRRGMNEDFLDAEESVVASQQVAVDELDEIVELLEHRGLVKGPRSLDGRPGNPAALTSDGVICVVDHDADVQKWNESRTMSYSNQSVNVTGNSNQVVGHSTNVNLSQSNMLDNVQTLRSAAEQALAGLDTYEIDEDEAADVRAAAEKVLVETANGEPEPGRLAKLAKRLWTALGLFFGTTVGTEFAQKIMDSIYPLIGLAG